MGTPRIAACSLAALADSFEVCAAFSQPDRPKGRGYELLPTPVKLEAQRLGIEVFQPASVRTPESIELIRGLKPDLIAVVAYGKILPQELLDIPRLGCINLHGSLLPAYRGAAPIERAVMNGEKVTGLTTMYMSAGMDEGDIISTLPIEIGADETGGELRERMSLLGGKLLVDTLTAVENGSAGRIAQDGAKATYAPMLKKEEGYIDQNRSAKLLYNQIRGLTPAPGAYCFVGGKRLKLSKVRLCGEMNGRAGSVKAEDGKLYLYCKDGALLLETVVFEGKGATDGYSFYNGKRFDKIDDFAPVGG